jgi:polyisoprenoid-binding protein YceI
MNWQFDAGHTHIGFTGRHLMVATVRGQFEKHLGHFSFKGAQRFGLSAGIHDVFL